MSEQPTKEGAAKVAAKHNNTTEAIDKIEVKNISKEKLHLRSGIIEPGGTGIAHPQELQVLSGYMERV